MAIKREDKFRTHRLMQIDHRIRNGEFPSVEEFQNEHGVSRRTILRDIEFLRDRYNAPLEYDREKKGYYYSDPTFLIQNVFLTEGELFTVSTLFPLMEQFKNTPLENSFRSIMLKISEMLPEQVSVDSSFFNSDVSYISDPLPCIDESVFNSIFKAIKIKQTIQFDYKSSGKLDFDKKEIDCYKVVCQKGNWYVLGHSHKKAEIRIYALSRIHNIQFLDKYFTIPEDFDINKYVDLSFGIWNNKEPAIEYELLFSKEVSTYIMEREWHSNQIIEQKNDGSVLLKFSSNQKQQVLSWILGFGNVVKVLNPPELVKAVKEKAMLMLKTYD